MICASYLPFSDTYIRALQDFTWMTQGRVASSARRCADAEKAESRYTYVDVPGGRGYRSMERVPLLRSRSM